MSDTASSLLRLSRQDASALIEQVRLRPCLWDRACASYRSRSRQPKEQAWRDVCQALHHDYDALSAGDKHEMAIMMMRKWYNIRDAFKKSFASRMSAGQSSRSYVYADQLTFLIPIFEGKAKDESIKFEPVEVESYEHEKEEWLSGVLELDHAEPSPEKRSKPEPENPRLKDTTETDDTFLSVLVNLIQKEDDEDRAFFKSITPAVKSLPDEMKFIFRIRVMKLLNNMTKENKAGNTVKNLDGSDTD